MHKTLCLLKLQWVSGLVIVGDLLIFFFLTANDMKL